VLHRLLASRRGWRRRDHARRLLVSVLGVNFGAAGPPHGNGESLHLGDFNDDGVVNLADFAILGTSFGCAP